MAPRDRRGKVMHILPVVNSSVELQSVPRRLCVRISRRMQTRRAIVVILCLVVTVTVAAQQQSVPNRAAAPQGQQQRPPNRSTPSPVQQRGQDLLDSALRSGSEARTGKVVHLEDGQPIAGARVSLKPVDLPNTFDKPCRSRTETDKATVTTLTDGSGEFRLSSVASSGSPLPSTSISPAPAATPRVSTPEDGAARRILELERLRRAAQNGVQAVDDRSVQDINIPLETIQVLTANATIPLADRVGGSDEFKVEHEGFVLTPPGGVPSSNNVFSMAPAPSLSGRIMDPYNRPIAGAVVQVYSVRIRPLGRMMKWVKSALTNDLGEYRVPYLDYGWYTIAVGNSSYVQQPWRDTLKLSPNLPNPDTNLSMMFFPGVENAADAELIHIRRTPPGVPKPVASMALRERPRYNVRVRLAAETIPTNANLIVVPAGGDVCATMDYAIKSNQDGTFDVRDLPRGRYEMVVISGRDVISPLTPITVEKNIDEFKIPVTRPLTVIGTVFFEDLPVGIDVNVLLGEIRINLTRARAEVSQVANSIADPRTFNFAIPGVGPGFYYPTVTLPPGAFVKDIHVAGVERVTGAAADDWKCNALPEGAYSYLDGHGHLEPLELPRDLATGNPDVTLCLKIEISFAGQMSGGVMPFVPPPPPTYIVVAMPRSVWGNYSDNGVTPPDRYLVRHRFEIFGVPMGDYRVFALPAESSELIYRKEFPQWFGAWAASVLYEYPSASPCPIGNALNTCVTLLPNQQTIDQIVP